MIVIMIFLKSKMDKLALIGLYRNWLKRHALVSHVSEIDYSDPRGFSYIAERQFGSYYEIISRLKKNIGDRIVVIPGDGVGTGSMICSLLEISYESSEPNGIGSVAIGLGIITSVEAVSKLDKSKVYFLANLSEFIDYRDYMICDYIIIDEDRLYPGYDSNAIKYSTHGRLHTNISSFDEYVTFPRVVSKAAVMLKGKKNVPMDSKSEYYLLEQGIPVYTDGNVITCGPSLPGGDHYIGCFF